MYAMGSNPMASQQADKFNLLFGACRGERSQERVAIHPVSAEVGVSF